MPMKQCQEDYFWLHLQQHRRAEAGELQQNHPVEWPHPGWVASALVKVTLVPLED